MSRRALRCFAATFARNAAARKRIQDRFASHGASFEEAEEELGEPVDQIRRSRRLLDEMHAEDKEEVIALQEAIESAVASHDQKSLTEAVRSLKELLFFVEGD
jgi:hypothetical protein